MKRYNYDILSKYFEYDHLSGLVFWKVSVGRKIKKGSIAGNIDGGYSRIQLKGVKYMAHIVAWTLYHKATPKHEIDHINGNRSDNRILNLRDVTRLENSRNKRKPKNNTSGCAGVHFDKSSNKWRARITIKCKKICLGYFDDFNRAKESVEKARVENGFHKNHGRE